MKLLFFILQVTACRFAVLLIFICFGCRKYAPVCNANCGLVNVNGKVINKITGAAVPGVPFALKWWTRGTLSSGTRIIRQINSASDGTFNFTASIDTVYFQRYYSLIFALNANSDYIILSTPGSYNALNYQTAQSAFQGLQFAVYRKANLKIRLHRTLTDDFKGYQILVANLGQFFDYYSVQSPQEVIDRNVKELNVTTIADVYTKIKTVKTFSNGASSETLDSLKCRPGTTNIVDVSF